MKHQFSHPVKPEVTLFLNVIKILLLFINDAIETIPKKGKCQECCFIATPYNVFMLKIFLKRSSSFENDKLDCLLTYLLTYLVKFFFQSRGSSEGHGSPRLKSVWINTNVMCVKLQSFSKFFIFEIKISQEIKQVLHTVAKRKNELAFNNLLYHHNFHKIFEFCD